jgi:hypothetical protein
MNLVNLAMDSASSPHPPLINFLDAELSTSQEKRTHSEESRRQSQADKAEVVFTLVTLQNVLFRM